MTTIIDIFNKNKFLLFLVFSFILYGNTLKNGYGLDDQFVTENNYTNEGLKSIPRIFKSHYAERDGKNYYEYRPLVKVSFAIEHQLFGVKPWVGHLINLILYAICVQLLFKVLSFIFEDKSEFFSISICLIFMSHPIHTEVVASLKNRDILLCFIFGMLMLLSIHQHFKTNKLFHLLYATIFCCLAFLSKLDVLPYFALVPLIFIKKYPKSKFSYFAISILFVFGFFFLKILKSALINKELTHRLLKYHENPLYFPHSFIDNISTALNSLGFYVKSLIFPSNLASYYGYNTLPIFNFLSIYSIIAYCTILILVYYFIKTLKSNSPLWYVILFFIIPISMYLNIVKPVPGIIADRYLFTSSIAWSILFIVLLIKFFNHNNDFKDFKSISLNTKLIFFGLLIIYSGLSISRNLDWKNRILLFEKDIKHQPQSVVLNLLYSNEVLVNLTTNNHNFTEKEKINQINQAVISLKTVLKIDSLNPTALNNLAFITHKVYNDFNGASKLYQKAYQCDSSIFEVQYNLAYCYFKTQQSAKAQYYILKAYPDNTDNQQVLDLLCYILIDNKNYEKGFQIFSKLIKENPTNSNLNIILGNFYLASKDSLNAKICYQKAYDLDKNNTQLSEIINKLSE
ncbi:MAG: hypothetical protein IT237_02480 [Bacteroidia bacterium]|nr:hypothetical protein [Bacteroidia bacterium]